MLTWSIPKSHKMSRSFLLLIKMKITNYNNQDPKSFATNIAMQLGATHNVDLLGIINNHALSVAEKKKIMCNSLIESIWNSIDAHNLKSGIDYTHTESDIEIMEALSNGTLSETDVELEPNITFTEHNANIIKDYQGDDVYNFVFTLTKRFENMANAKTPGQLAIEIVSGSLVSVGIAMAVGTIKAWRAGATLLNAVRTGVTSIGMKTAVAVVVFVLVALLLFLLLDNPKKIIGLLMNNTDHHLVVNNWRKGIDGDTGGDLYLEHGFMGSFPEDHEDGDLDSPLVQLRKRFYFGPGDEENTVCAGIYFGDRNFGLRGVEGIMVFTSSTTEKAIAHQFAVPYTKDNGTNMSALNSAPLANDLPDLFRTMYDSRMVRVDKNENGFNLTSTVNDARGGIVALIGNIEQA